MPQNAASQSVVNSLNKSAPRPAVIELRCEMQENKWLTYL